MIFGHTPPRILGVFAHPDDETFCAGGTLAKYVEAGAEVMVVSFTQGEAGQIRDAQAATRRTLGQVRSAELTRASQKLGVQHAICFDYGDGKLQELDPKILVKKVVELIRCFRPHVVITFGEDGAYGHPDHIAISKATTEAYRLAGYMTEFPEHLAAGLSIHQPDSLYHSYFPRSGLTMMKRLAKWQANLDRQEQRSVDFAHALMLLAEESTTLGFANDHVQVKWYPNGFYLIEQGEKADSLYLILSGEVDVYREGFDGRLTHLNRRGPGTFIGEQGLAYNKRRNAHVVAVDHVTCLVFTPGEPSAFGGRGAEAHLAGVSPAHQQEASTAATTAIDVSAYIELKIAALAEHRTQYPLEPAILPQSLLQEMLGHEYFVRIDPAIDLESELFTASSPLSIQSIQPLFAYETN